MEEGAATREMGDDLNLAYPPPGGRRAGRWEIDTKEAISLREMGDSAKNGLSPNGRWEIYPKLPYLPVGDGAF